VTNPSVRPEIALKGITKSYGNHVALPGLDLECAKGSFVTLLGPSGCGKTTTLRIIAGLEQPTAGEVNIAGRTVYSSRSGLFVPPEKRGLGFIFQNYALWPNMKVDRNVTLALTEAGMSPDTVNIRLREALARVQLDAYGDRYPSELSGGQQQRVAVARLIAARNSILLMDEPLSNLDAVLRTEMRITLKRLSRELDATTVYVTHDQVEALTMSDQIVVMHAGVIMQQGTPYEIYHHPANRFVAEFIGDPRINFLSGVLRKAAGAAAIEFDGVSIPLPVSPDCPPGPVSFSIRPESVSILERPSPVGIAATLDVLQPTGAQTIAMLNTAGSRVTALIPRFVQSLPSGPLWLSFDPALIALFDPQTGKRISTVAGHDLGIVRHGT
jgi:multiple sugar transport system ATP-binding protein